MLNRPIVMTGMLGAAVAGPYVATNAPDNWAQWQAPPASTAADTQDASPADATAPATAAISGPEHPNALLYESPTRLEGTGFYSLEQVLRMDISKNWVYQHWARKSTGLADPELFGIRVPLVTGTGMTDLAGSLSYYFNGAGQVDRIRFKGVTADTSSVVALMQRHGLAWQAPRVPGEQLMQARSGDQVVSQLRTFPEPVLWSTKPHGSFGVELELNRPGSGRYVENLAPPLKLPGQDQSVVASQPSAPAPQGAVAKGAAPPSPAESATPQSARRPDFRWPN